MRTFYCIACEKDIDSPKALKAHVLEIHHLDLDTVKGKRKGLMFMDGRDFYENTYEWEFKSDSGVLRVQEFHSGKRGKRDPMRYS